MKKQKKKKRKSKKDEKSTLFVPSDIELKDLMRRIKKENDKKESYTKSIKTEHINKTNSIIQDILNQFKNKDPMLLLKILALECLKEIHIFHNENSEKYFNDRDLDYAKIWYKDQLLLKECEKNIKRISLGENDWT